jgi:hypothetical protein
MEESYNWNELYDSDEEYMQVQEDNCPHSWVAGMMYVPLEDLDIIARIRTVECERCELVYSPSI